MEMKGRTHQDSDNVLASDFLTWSSISQTHTMKVSLTFLYIRNIYNPQNFCGGAQAQLSIMQLFASII